MDNQKLLEEANQLYIKLVDAFDSEIYKSPSKRTKKILNASKRALRRLQRRLDNLQNRSFLPLSPSQSFFLLG